MPIAVPMPTFEAGDIVRVPFPYTDRPVRQHRPALVVSKAGLGPDRELHWVLMITSAENRRWTTDVPVPASRETGLPADSLVRTAKIATIEGSSASLLGRLPEALLIEVRAHLRTAMA